MVTQAERGRCFEFAVGPDDGPYVRWTPPGAQWDGTRVTEVWEVEQLPPTLQSWTQEQLAERVRYTEDMLTKTLPPSKRQPRAERSRARPAPALGPTIKEGPDTQSPRSCGRGSV